MSGPAAWLLAIVILVVTIGCAAALSEWMARRGSRRILAQQRELAASMAEMARHTAETMRTVVPLYEDMESRDPSITEAGSGGAAGAGG